MELSSKSTYSLPKRTKLNRKIIDCVFLDFANASAAYRFVIYKFEIFDKHLNNTIESKNAEFFVHVFSYSNRDMNNSSRGTFHFRCPYLGFGT